MARCHEWYRLQAAQHPHVPLKWGRGSAARQPQCAASGHPHLHATVAAVEVVNERVDAGLQLHALVAAEARLVLRPGVGARL